LVPSMAALDTEGLDLSSDAMGELLKVDTAEWKAQLPQMHAHFAQFGDDLPEPLRRQLRLLEERLG
jgi:phosphoenolpyruvate carboxykinase (GTP)